MLEPSQWIGPRQEWADACGAFRLLLLMEPSERNSRRDFEGDHKGFRLPQEVGLPHARIDDRTTTRGDDDFGTGERTFEQLTLNRSKRGLTVVAEDVGDRLAKPTDDAVVGVGNAPPQTGGNCPRDRRLSRAAEPNENDSLRHRRPSLLTLFVQEGDLEEYRVASIGEDMGFFVATGQIDNFDTGPTRAICPARTETHATNLDRRRRYRDPRHAARVSRG